MDSPGSIIDALGGTKRVAEALGEAVSTVSGWRSRGIPGTRWVALVDLAKTSGRNEITLEVLASAARKPEPVEGRT